MLRLLIRKMINTRWMVLCLLIGFIMAAGMMSTVPIYMDASLQRILVKDMEKYQVNTNSFPGEYVVSKTIPFGVSIADQIKYADELSKTVEREANDIPMPISNGKVAVRDDFLYMIVADIKEGTLNKRIKMQAMTGLEEHITIVKGRMYNPGLTDGVYEVICTDAVLQLLGIIYDKEYTVVNAFYNDKQPLTVKVVGVYEQKSETDSYWSETMIPYVNSLMMDYNTFFNSLLQTGTSTMTDIYIKYDFDYQKMNLNNLAEISEKIKKDFTYFKQSNVDFSMGIYDILENYSHRAQSLRQMLWVLQIPSIIMLAFYLYMVSQLNVEQEKNQIAVFKSRGASSKQIFVMYAVEAGILGLITLILAPFIGLVLCRFLGVSNGFLEFVNRPSIPAAIGIEAFKYAFLAVAVFFVTTMIPIIPASKLSIVQFKQNKAKVVKMSIWEKSCIDVLLLAGSLGWLYYTTNKINKEILNGTFVGTGEINPLIFVFSCMFVLGAGLLFIRLYPILLKIIYYAGRRFWSPAQYIALTSVSRTGGGRERFLMIFLVITFSFGIFSANTARAINNNKSERISYTNGADIIMEEFWIDSSGGEGNSDTLVQYKEPEFERFLELDGVEAATKVLRKTDVQIKSDNTNIKSANLMAVAPSEFADIAWFRNDLLPIHWWNYCNALVDYKTGILASSSLKEKYNFELGDNIQIKWGKNDYFDGTIIAFIDFWPGVNPNEIGANGFKDFLVMNYNYVNSQTNLEPYQVWIKMQDGANSANLYNSISSKKMPIQSLLDSSQMLISAKTDPDLQGMNGALTLGFIIIMIMTIIGFLIYWILSIKSRTLQFGILRAMGVSFGEIIRTLAYEQILVSGISICMAIIIGGVASDLFVPLFQSMYDVAEQIPPFRISAMRADYIKIYVIILLMLSGGFAVLGRLIGKIKISQALKLGED